MFSFKVLIFMACLAWTFSNDSKYCSLCKKHTMCTYKEIGPGCKESGASGVSESDKKLIIDLHNKYRRIVASGKEKRGASGGQPKAADLRKFVWDNDLAKVAQRWANQCHFGHDSCRNDPRFLVGQNVHWESSTPKRPVNWTRAVTNWFDEVSMFNPKDIPKFRFESKTGHYTQLAWHDTYAVGCGRKEYGNQILCVCNYGPAGNVIGGKMYTVGEPCSSCPEGTTCEDSLCAAKTISSRSDTLPDNSQIPNSYWRSNVIPEEVISSEPSTPKESPSSILLREVINAGGEDIELDEETNNEIKRILAEIENLLRTSLKKYRNMHRLPVYTPLEVFRVLNDQ